MFTRRPLLVLAWLALVGLGVHAAPADDLLPVWKRSDGEAHIRLSAPKNLPKGKVSVPYQLVAVNTALDTPEMVIASFGVVCSRKTGEPVTLTLSRTTMFRFVDGTLVQDSDEPLSPPREVSLESFHDFASKPAGVARARALAMLKAPR
ncbi:MAG TPA: hypothetical protein VLE45_15580 [Burkholderiaceae bacterium]|nr:hypothetical protein [Burkholderiaceae bacterium]